MNQEQLQVAYCKHCNREQEIFFCWNCNVYECIRCRCCINKENIKVIDKK